MIRHQTRLPHSRGFILANFIISVFRRDPSMARRWAEECLPFAGEQGFPKFVALALIAQGWPLAEGRRGDRARHSRKRLCGMEGDRLRKLAGLVWRPALRSPSDAGPWPKRRPRWTGRSVG
jgi:hypothetical protein